MKNFILAIVTIIFTVEAHAGVLERIRLEDAVQARVEKSLREYDKNARVELSFSFRKNEPLPGTTLADSEDMQPTMMEEGDISRINVKVYASAPDLMPEMKATIYRSIPVRKSRIKITYVQQNFSFEPPVPPIKTQDLTDITTGFARLLSQVMVGIVATSILLLAALAFYLSNRNQRRTREYIEILSRAIGETGGSKYLPQTVNGTGASGGTTSGEFTSKVGGVGTLPVSALKELFADCYWCEADGYAHWLWKRLTPEQKKNLFVELNFLKNYSAYFVSVKAVEWDYHDHPYYLAPENLAQLSQEDLGKELKKNPDYWILMSPLRQKNMTMPIAEKLRVVQKTPLTRGSFKSNVVSSERTLQAVANWGDVTLDDEQTIFANPEMVPQALRHQVRSLVWLSLREPQYIVETLSQYDARALASAWIGGAAVLETLEKALPEKKLKLLKNYCGQISASRESATYQSLVDEGLADEAA